jgi:putative transposase
MLKGFDADTITFKRLKKITGVPVRTLQEQAKRENWPYKPIPRKPRRFFISGLPDAYQMAIYAHPNKETTPDAAPNVLQPCPPCSATHGGQAHFPNPPALFVGESRRVPVSCYQQARKPALQQQTNTNKLPAGARLDKGMAKADLLRLYTRCIISAGHGRKMRARTEFMRAYNSGIVYPALFQHLGPVSWQTVEGWKRTVKISRETFELCDDRGVCRRGQRALTDEQSQILLRCALHPNKPLISEAIRMAWAVMHTGGISNGHAEITYRRWLKDWISTHHHIWTFTREGASAWNDNCAMYIERDYNLINVGDILVADGHTLNFEIVNPWTGKPKRMALILWYDMKSSFPLGWEIMPTENTQAISAALRRAILRLGKYPQVAYLDNGKAFRARFFQNMNFEEAGFEGIYKRLGIKTIFAWPYHGQSKTVERFFGTFAELERMMPTYTGTSIENKPPRMNRGEKLHRRVYDKIVGDNCLTMEQAHCLIAAWFDDYAQRPQRGHLDGQAPINLLMEGKGPGVDKAELVYLMMSEENRTIHRNGIQFHGTNYYDPALYGRRHPATIKYDLQDPSEIHVYGPNDEYICAARPVEKVHPAANILGTTEDQERLKRHIENKKRQEKEASILAREILETEVLPAHRRQIAQIVPEQLETANTKNVRRLPAPAPKQTELEKEIADLLQKQRDEKSREEQEMQRRIEEGMRQYHESLGKTIRRQDADPHAEIPKETILDDDANVWNILPEMAEKDRYEKLAEFEVRGWVIPKKWQAYMSYFEQTPEYEANEDYFDEHRGRIAQMYQTHRRDIYD